MNGKTRGGFYALWTMTILVSLCACLFVLAWVSIKDGGDAAAVAPPAADQSQQDQTQTDQSQQDQAAVSQDGQQLALPGDGLPTGDDMSGEGASAGDASGEAAMTQPEGNTAVPEAGVSPTVILGDTADMGMDYLNRLIFLGDSTTYGLYAYGVLPHYQVWTPASGTMSLFNYAVETIDYTSPGSADSSQSLPIMDCAADCQPEYLVITLGINGIAILDETQFKEYYTNLIRDILYASPNTKIICNSIYPVIDEKTPEGIKNANVNAANGWILDVATEMGVRYLNSHDALTDESGNLSTQYVDAENDGIHMNATGYNAVLQYVRTHAWT